MSQSTRANIFLSRIKDIFLDTISYSDILYINSTTKVKITCLKHNHSYYQTPKKLLLGQNSCPYCNGRINQEQFIELSQKIYEHNDYSLVKYKNKKTQVKIRCKKHGFIYEKTPELHLQGQGCPKCSSSYMDNEYFLEKANKIHNNGFDYLSKYVKSDEKITIRCKVCDHVFKQTPNHHLRKHGCPKCANIKRKKELSKNTTLFNTECNEIHKNKYIYPDRYVNSHKKIRIICSKHGDFFQRPTDHKNNKQGCPECAKEKKYSDAEIKINSFIKSLNIKTISSDRKILNGYELDIYIPEHNLAIEFDGLYWHNELYKENNYHLNKTTNCNKKNIQLIHIFEDEWLERPDVVKSILKNKLKLTDKKIYARKCIIKEIEIKEAKSFFNNNHIQGYTNSTVKLGLYYKDELISAMLFSKKNINGRLSFDGYELSRFVNKINYSNIGAASKLLKYFELKYKPLQLRSYADRRWFDGKMYETLGFKQTHINPPSYWYVIGNKRKHKSLFKKSNIRKQGFLIEGKTEHDVMLERNIYRIYDCGTITYNKKYK